MKKQIILACALTFGALSLAAAPSKANAFDGAFRNGEIIVKIGHKKKHRRFRHRHGHFGFHYGPNCRYYLRKAKWTGRHYWWRKYERCMWHRGFAY